MESCKDTARKEETKKSQSHKIQQFKILTKNIFLPDGNVQINGLGHSVFKKI